jgi:3'-phosphoadenosine 5'-phosphosulfate sulfotransferase
MLSWLWCNSLTFVGIVEDLCVIHRLCSWILDDLCLWLILASNGDSGLYKKISKGDAKPAFSQIHVLNCEVVDRYCEITHLIDLQSLLKLSVARFRMYVHTKSLYQLQPQDLQLSLRVLQRVDLLLPNKLPNIVCNTCTRRIDMTRSMLFQQCRY